MSDTEGAEVTTRFEVSKGFSMNLFAPTVAFIGVAAFFPHAVPYYVAMVVGCTVLAGPLTSMAPSTWPVRGSRMGAPAQVHE